MQKSNNYCIRMQLCNTRCNKNFHNYPNLAAAWSGARMSSFIPIIRESKFCLSSEFLVFWWNSFHWRWRISDTEEDFFILFSQKMGSFMNNLQEEFTFRHDVKLSSSNSKNIFSAMWQYPGFATIWSIFKKILMTRHREIEFQNWTDWKLIVCLCGKTR